MSAYNSGWENVTDMKFTSTRHPAFVSDINVQRVSRSKVKDPILTLNCLLNSEIWTEFHRMFLDSIFAAQRKGKSMY